MQTWFAVWHMKRHTAKTCCAVQELVGARQRCAVPCRKLQAHGKEYMCRAHGISFPVNLFISREQISREIFWEGGKFANRSQRFCRAVTGRITAKISLPRCIYLPCVFDVFCRVVFFAVCSGSSVPCLLCLLWSYFLPHGKDFFAVFRESAAHGIGWSARHIRIFR